MKYLITTGLAMFSGALLAQQSGVGDGVTSQIPEPSIAVLLAAGVAGIYLVARKKK